MLRVPKPLASFSWGRINMLEADHASREDLAKPRTPFAGLVLRNLEMIGRLRWCSLVNDLCSPTLQKVKGLHGFQHPPSYCMEYHAFLSHSLIHSLAENTTTDSSWRPQTGNSPIQTDRYKGWLILAHVDISQNLLLQPSTDNGI